MRRAGWLLVLLVLAACGGDDESAPPAEPGTTTEPAVSVGAGCREVETPEPRAEGTLEPPSAALPTDVDHRIRVETNCGAFMITLDPAASPNAAASFAALADTGFFDNTIIHRVVSGFVIQGGDPGGTGMGGPGYTTVDTPAPDTTYTRGTVAMAKTGADPAGTAGSQFFVVTAEDAGLPPDYAVIGSVTAGMETVDAIEALAIPGTEQPSQPIVVERMTLETG